MVFCIDTTSLETLSGIGLFANIDPEFWALLDINSSLFINMDQSVRCHQDFMTRSLQYGNYAYSSQLDHGHNIAFHSFLHHYTCILPRINGPVSSSGKRYAGNWARSNANTTLSVDAKKRVACSTSHLHRVGQAIYEDLSFEQRSLVSLLMFLLFVAQNSQDQLIFTTVTCMDECRSLTITGLWIHDLFILVALTLSLSLWITSKSLSY